MLHHHREPTERNRAGADWNIVVPVVFLHFVDTASIKEGKLNRGVRGTLLARADGEADIGHVGCVVDVSSLVEGQACSALGKTGLIDTLLSIDWGGRTLLFVECARE
jgi:hypothetical protein